MEQLLHAPLDLGRRPDLVHLERLGDDEADPLALIQARIRILEDHHQLAPDQRISVRLRCVMSAVKLMSPLVGSSRRMMQRHRRLATARLADDAERLPLLDREADPVDGLDARDLFWKTIPRVTGKYLTRSSTTNRSAVIYDASASVPARSLATSLSFVSSSRWQAWRCRGESETERQLGHDRAADREDVRAARVKAAPLRRVQERRRLPWICASRSTSASSRGREPSSPTCRGGAAA